MNYHTAAEIMSWVPGVRAWYLSSPTGRRYMVKRGETPPEGRFRLIAVID